jgi:hypothetical protein
MIKTKKLKKRENIQKPKIILDGRNRNKIVKLSQDKAVLIHKSVGMKH